MFLVLGDFNGRSAIVDQVLQFADKYSRRGARVAEWDGLENRCAGNCTVGSNPTLSALSSEALAKGGLD